jgi:hypothetical protein
LLLLLLLSLFLFIFRRFFLRNIYYSDFERFDRFDEFYFLIELLDRTVQSGDIVNLIRKISGVGDLIVAVFVIVFGWQKIEFRDKTDCCAKFIRLELLFLSERIAVVNILS